jgi:predicted amidohydrolase YtcJ
MRIGPRLPHDLRIPAAVGIIFSALLLSCSSLAREREASLLLTGGRVWTGWNENPWAEAVAVRGDRILAVGSASDLDAYRGRNTQVLELEGRFVSPGFIDSHTHFDAAGSLLLGINLLQAENEAEFVAEVRAARDRLPEGAWITGGDWGAYEAWAAGSTGGVAAPGDAADTTSGAPDEPDAQSFAPHRSMIDSITPETPVLLSRWDGSLFLANELALIRAGATCAWRGVECVRGRATGRLSPRAAELVGNAIPRKTFEQRLLEARMAEARLRESGVTTIHDITPAEQMDVFQALLDAGELTVRVYARPALDRWEELARLGVRHGFGSDWLKIGGLKGYVDGIMGNSSARFYEPYVTTGRRGSWRDMMGPRGNMQRLLVRADATGQWPQVHAIGDQAIDTLLTMFQRTVQTNGQRDRRFRIIHAQVLRGPETAERMARLGVIAEMQPYHAIDDMRWMEERFRTLQEAGVRLSFGSDWPGTNASWYPASPLLGIYAAVTRQTLGGAPDDGWHPEERIDLETALRAYTVNNAWAAGEEDLKGSLEPGKLADIVVVDRDPFAIDPSELKNCRVLFTIVGGRVIYQRREGDVAGNG